MMGKGLKNSGVPSRQTLKGQAKNRVQHLQSMVNELQLARKQQRDGDVTKLEEQVNDVLREWKTELDEPSPASSFVESLGSFEQWGSLLQQFDIEDDATSPLTGPSTVLRGDGNEHGHVDMTNRLGVTDCPGDKEAFYLEHTSPQHAFQRQRNHIASHVPHEHSFQDFVNHVPNHVPPQHGFQDFENHSQQQYELHGFDHRNHSPNVANDLGASCLNNLGADNMNMSSQVDYLNPNEHPNFDTEFFLSASDVEQLGLNDLSDFSDVSPNVNIQPSAFLGPKCALWDCARPAQVSGLCNNYCSSFHSELARKECPPGSTPVVRPGGIGLKDGPLISALKLKIEGKDVGIPECPGAASTKSPWNAPELFDISFLKDETIREWLFFDKPRRAFETGTRKQRSLPDHEGRGWHESRKLPLSGGQKRSYYADPQPQKHLEWHLYEYEVDNVNTFALYRLELKEKSSKPKVADDKKKSPKTKVINEVLDLQKQMATLTAVVSTEDKPSGKGKAKDNVQSYIGNVPGSS